MILSAFSNFLDSAFASFDYAILSFFHSLYETADWFFSPFFKTITLLGDKAIAMIILGLILLIFKRTRKAGICVLASLAIGGLAVNLILKPLVDRSRPYQSVEELRLWWEAVGGLLVSDRSFPSGHTNIVACAMTALALSMGKRWIAPCAMVTLLVGASRLYLMVHYPTDVLGGLICGISAGFAAWLIVGSVYKLIDKNKSRV